MLVVSAGTMQALLVCELLLRRILFLCLPSRRVALQRYADNAALSSFAALLLQTATVPLQALASVVATLGQFWVLVLLGCVGFAALLSISGNSVYVYVVLARMYNFGVAPWVTAGQWLFVILDFAFRALTPLYNGFVFFGSEVLRKIVLPYSFHNIETLPEMLQGLTLMLVSFGTSISTWLQNVLDCSVLHQPAIRICGESIAGGKSDCTTAFTPMYTECFANPNHFTIDILTPGLFARQTALALRRVLATHCGVGALVLNFLLFPDNHDRAHSPRGSTKSGRACCAGSYSAVGACSTITRTTNCAQNARGGSRALALCALPSPRWSLRCSRRPPHCRRPAWTTTATLSSASCATPRPPCAQRTSSTRTRAGRCPAFES
jgi:hypothetical protein